MDGRHDRQARDRRDVLHVQEVGAVASGAKRQLQRDAELGRAQSEVPDRPRVRIVGPVSPGVQVRHEVDVRSNGERVREVDDICLVARHPATDGVGVQGDPDPGGSL